MARYILLFLVLLVGSFSAMAQQSTSTFEGKVTDADTKEPLPFATVSLYKSGSTSPAAGTNTDMDGNFSISNVDPGKYDAEISYTGYSKQRLEGITLYAGEIIRQNIALSEGGVDIGEEVVIIEYLDPLIKQDNTTQGKTITGADIANLPSKSIAGIAATTAGVSSSDDGGALTMRGSRSNATIIYVDGIRMNGNMVPQTEVEQLQIMTGGIGAAYGDATGGVIAITTKGPSEKLSGNFEIENSNYLDPYGYLLAYASFSGPLLKRYDEALKREKSVLGYRLGVQYRQRGDRDPAAGGVYKVKDDVYNDLVANPVTPSTNGTLGVPKQYYLTADDVELSLVRPNNSDKQLDINGKIDYRLNKAIDMSFGGGGVYSSANLADTRRAASTTEPRTLTNYHNNPLREQLQYRGYGRFRHRISTADDTASVIRNLSYTLQFSYEHREQKTMNATHKDNFFDYGYVGKFDWEDNVTYFAAIDSASNPSFFINRNIVNFTGGDKNPGLVAYNAGFTDLPGNAVGDDFYAYNGRELSASTIATHSLFDLVNEVYNAYNKQDFNQYQFNVTGSFDFVPKSSEQGKHIIEFGLLYEQRMDRSWTLQPRNLWTIGRQLLNQQFAQGRAFVESIDVDPTTGDTTINYQRYAFDDLNANEASQQNYFDKQVRTKFGYGRYDEIYMDELNPDDLSLDLFSADDLLKNLGLNDIDYYGYDVYGNPLDGTTTFADFWTEKDANGNYTRPVAPNQPIYTAAYIQDKFSYKDIIFRVGLRIDRYDANTKVLNDRYSFFGVTTVGDYRAANPDAVIPASVGDDFAIYSNDNNISKLEGVNISAYRSGDEWYNAEGVYQNNVRTGIGVTNLVIPISNTSTDIQSPNYDFESAFKDAAPQISVMPRLAFSFPINENAGFFAHYDVLTQRAPSNTLTTALDYFRFFQITQDVNANLNNPELKPEKTIDYEVGFQQVVSASSAIKVSLYYKELRDMIQSQFYFNASPRPYFGFGNQDFGTVKGVSLEYDLRRTGNVRMVVNYTLQFADGTASSADAQRSSVSLLGNLRSTSPLSFDERHRLTMTFDYRYGSGRKYNGPEINGRQILANTGFNLLMIGASGRPYSRAQFISGEYSTVGTQGSFNGARLPWNTRMDFRVDKDIVIRKGSSDGENKKDPLSINVYLRVQNLLDKRNLTGVYEFSQSAYDTGYLNSPFGISNVNQISDPAVQLAYTTSYMWSMVNPGFFTLPRRIYLGAVFNF